MRGTRIVQMDRRARDIRDEAGVVAKFGVPPASIPDYLALVGDASDGYPGLPGWGAKSTAAVLAKFGHLEVDPRGLADVGRERHQARGAVAPRSHANASAPSCSAISPRSERDVPVFDTIDALRWDGPTPAFAPIAARLDAAREFRT